MKCPSCGKENPAGEQYCLDCGSDLSATSTATAGTPVAASPGGVTGAAPNAAGGSLAMSDEEFQRLLQTPPARTCPHCGAPAPASGNFCDSCGEPLTAQPADATPGQAAPAAAAQAVPVQSGTPQSGQVDQTPTAPILDPKQPATPAPPARAAISFDLSGPTSSSSYTMTGGAVTIGRRDADAGIYPEIDFDGNDVVVDAGERVHAVSRRHARIFLDGDVLKFEDVGSTNGSTLNGTPVLAQDPQPLKDGDRIVLGRTCRITVHMA